MAVEHKKLMPGWSQPKILRGGRSEDFPSSEASSKPIGPKPNPKAKVKVQPKRQAFRSRQGKKQKTDAMEVDEGPKEQESEANVQPPKKVDEPKAETQAEAKSEPKVSPKVDEPKVEPKVAEPQVEPKVDEPKVEPKVDEQKVEPKVDEPKVDPKVDEPKVDPKAKAGEMAEAKVEPRTESEAKDVEMNEEEKTSMPLQPHQGSHYHQRRLAEKAQELKLEDEGEHTVYVANLDWSVDEAQLYRIFQEVEGLKEVRLVRDFLKRSKGYAYVDFDSPQRVVEAVEKFSGHLINNRAMKVAKSLPTKQLYEEKVLFVRNIGEAATEEDVKEAFQRHGEVVGVRMPRMDDRHKGYAYVEFTSDDAVKACLALELTIGGQQVTLARSIPMKDHRHITAGMRKDLPQRVNQHLIVRGKMDREDPVRQSAKCPTTVYVKNLDFDVDDAALTKHFESCGEVAQVLIVKTNDGRSRGFGFVEFADNEGAQTALMLSDSILGGREIVVSKSFRAITQKKCAAKDDEEEEGKGSKGKFKGKGEKGEKGKGKGKGKDKGKRRRRLEDSDGESEAKKPRHEESNGEDGEKPSGPMSNADFRKFLMS